MDEKSWLPGKQGKWRQSLKKRPHGPFKAALLFFGVLILLPWFSACAKNTLPPKPPLILPFAVQKAGNKVETDLRIVEHREYTFSLQFTFKEDDQEDRVRVKKLVGSAWKDEGDTGIPTPLKLKVSVIEPAGERVIVDKEVPELRLRSWGGNFFQKHIDYVTLEPGLHRVSVVSLQDAPDLTGIPMALIISANKPK